MGRRDAVQVTLEVIARMRELEPRLVVSYEPGWETRGNGTTANYEGGIVHHTASPSSLTRPFPTQGLLRDGRKDLAGPLCNEACPACTVDAPRIHVVAAHPANHAGASGGKSMGPLPVTSLFNPRVRGLEIDYAGTVPMLAGQLYVGRLWTRANADVVGGGDVQRIRAHFETSVTGKVDIGYAPGKTYDMAAFRRDAANLTTAATAPLIEDDDMKLIQSTNRGIALVGPNYYRGLTTGEEVQQAVNLWGSPVIGNDRQFDLWVSMAIGGESADSSEIVGVGRRFDNTEAAVGALTAAVAARPATAGSVSTGQALDYKALATSIVDEQDRRARDGDPVTGPVS